MLITLQHNSDFARSAETIPDVPSMVKSSSYILKTKAKDLCWKYSGAHLSIKSAVTGQALYETNNGRYMPTKDTYLILNPEQSVCVTVGEHAETQGIIIYFAEGFAEEVYRSMTAQTDLLLDAPQMAKAARLEFVQRLYPQDNILSPALSVLWNSLDIYGAEQAWYEEQLHRIMQQLLHVHWNVCQEIASLPALRATTREEIYRRIYRARDYIAASIDQPLTLNEMARVACLSPNHFMRMFKQVFRLTPHQYLTNLRLERAKWLLHQPELPITEICFLVGFDSLGYFSWLFHRRVGISPQAYRQQKKIITLVKR
jgi:AraC family transcriptional regulator